MDKRNPAFISIIGVVQTHAQSTYLAQWLTNLHEVVRERFTHYELVLVNNHCDAAVLDGIISRQPEALRKLVFMLNLSAPVSRDNAMLAGLDRANGDYCVVFEFDFREKPELIDALWAKAQEGFDIVYLRGPSHRLSWLRSLLQSVFYGIMARYSGLRLDRSAHHTRIISRRALNSLLRLRERSHYLKANYALVGYNTTAIDVPQPVYPEPGARLSAQFRSALVAVTSYTTFLNSLLLWIFLVSVLIAGVSIFNAVKVKLTQVDIFGDYQETLSGWAFLVVMVSSFFAITCLNLYVMSIYLSNIYTELKNRPPYIIESVRRF
jgi:glycosyltransferase involved in cell wall biosynthesis